MAVDKLVDSTQLNSDLTSVANAIREKTGGTSSLAFPSGYVTAINSIPIYSTKSVEKNLTKVTISNSASTVISNNEYYAELTPDSGYFISSVTVQMGGTNITSQAFSGVGDGFSVTTNLLHYYIKNIVSTRSSFKAELLKEPGIVSISEQVKITMGGMDVSNYYSSGVINIQNVTGDIVITAVATVADVSSISAMFMQGSNMVLSTDSLDTLRQYLTVTATYSNGATSVVTDYTLSGTLTAGESTVTVSYSGKTTTFTVDVTAWASGYTKFDYIYNNVNLTDIANDNISLGLSATYCDPQSYEHILDMELESYYGNNLSSGIYGLRPSTGSAGSAAGLCAWVDSSSSGTDKIAFGYNGVDSGYTIPFTRGTRRQIKLNSGNIYINGTVAYTASGTYTSFSGENIKAFGVHTVSNNGDASSHAKIRFYRITISNISSGQKVADLIPCKNSSSKPGFYDTVRQTFYSATNYTKYTCANEA